MIFVGVADLEIVELTLGRRVVLLDVDFVPVVLFEMSGIMKSENVKKLNSLHTQLISRTEVVNSCIHALENTVRKKSR